MYKIRNINGVNFIFRVSDSSIIPEYLANADYIAYLAWVAAGNVAPPY